MSESTHELAIHYRILPGDWRGHYFDIELTIANPDPEGQTLRLPAWLPGSYMIRDFARHIIEFSAQCETHPIHYNRLDKQTWQLQACDGPLHIRYRVYAFDLSVRTAYLDGQFGFYNHSALCLEVVDQADSPCIVDIELPDDKSEWLLVTGMPRQSGEPLSAGRFYAESYDALIDYPVLMGDLTIDEFIVQGIRHRIAIAGQHFADMERIGADLAKICNIQLELFEDNPPFANYTFLVMVTGDGFGGLEHRNSTALLCSRKDLIHSRQPGATDSYRTFLSLCSHEYFHSWNIKRLRPREFIPFHLDKEQYTGQLWFYEGVTSYYDDLLVQRAGLASVNQYLETLGASISRALLGQGPQRQTLLESSQLAWTTFYQQNENAPNAISSYYTKGALTALLADLIIRRESHGRDSLDDVMRHLWLAYGRDGRGTTLDNLLEALIDFGGEPMRDLLHLALKTTNPLPVAELLTTQGIKASLQAAESDNGPYGKAARMELPVSLGARYKAAEKSTEQGVELVQVFEGGSVWQAGLSARDRIIAIDHLAFNLHNQYEFLTRFTPGDQVTVHAFRGDQLLVTELVWQAPVSANWVLEIADTKQAAGWLLIQPDAASSVPLRQK